MDTNCRLCLCTVFKPLSLPPSQVKSISHLERPGNHTVILCSTHSLTYPGCHAKHTHKGNIRGTGMGEKILETKRYRSHFISLKPWRLRLQLESCSASGFPVSIQQSRQWPRENQGLQGESPGSYVCSKGRIQHTVITQIVN